MTAFSTWAIAGEGGAPSRLAVLRLRTRGDWAFGALLLAVALAVGMACRGGGARPART